MVRESRGLGRGLDALLGVAPAAPARGIGTLPLTQIQAGAMQPRRDIHAEPLEELAASIRVHGVIQPIVVRKLVVAAATGERYEIVAGERRWQAAKLAGLSEIPALVREFSDQDAMAVALIENIQREELTAAEEARAFKRLIQEFSLTHQAVADSVGRSRAAVSNQIRLLELPEVVVAMIDSKALGMGHARALLGLEGDEERVKVARRVVDQGLSVRETEKLVRRMLEGEGDSAPVKKRPELSVVSQVMRTDTVQVQLHQRASGGGKIIVDFANPHARDEILELIRAFEADDE